MAFELEPVRPLPDEVRRVAGETLDDALGRLRGETGETLEMRIHEARKRTKEARAVLRLARPALGESAFRAHNRALRDAARLLSPVRDAQVLHTLVADHDVEAAAVDAPDPDAAERAAEALEARVRSEQGRLAQARTVQRTVEAIAEVRSGVAEWPLVGDRWRTIGPGLRRSWKLARDGMAEVARGRAAEARHEWRKRVKDTWYHLRLLTPLWPESLATEAEEAHRLSDLLGDVQDLAVLVHELGAGSDLALAEADREALSAWAARRQVPLLTEALRLGARVHAERPQAYEARMKAYWHAARETDPRAAEVAERVAAPRDRAPTASVALD
ncbi:CHAD domain-containing protein [Egibacter rhizosphaerae]|uniref:CHAD domain-containing protein n=1 Tax=Egibacter rhizosphaerae TaxID=1670831 RepID=A0A411YKD3_9ACTN|nr:CHAD domain-containing protein [Egibacter rhizosphaerae]QBI21640.1 CHAD domain-containing protein [Egibacter rhizosphaerae]